MATQAELDAEAAARVSGEAAATRSIAQVAHGLAVGDAVRFNGTAYVKAQADTAAHAEAVGLVSAVASANAFTLVTGGYVTGLSGLTAGEVYFLSAATAGALTGTEPTTVGQVSKPLLVADSITSGYLFIFRGALVGAVADAASLGFEFFGSITGGGSATSVPNGGGGEYAAWVQAPSGFYPGQTALLDLTAPTSPEIITSGIYSFSVEGEVTGAYAGKYLSVTLFLDTDGIFDGPGQRMPLDAAVSRANPACCMYLAAGMKVQLHLYQDTGGALDVDTWMLVQRVA